MKKGISPLVATIILISLAIGVTAVVGPELIDFVREQTSETTEKSITQVECSRAGIYVREAVYNSSTNELKFRVENTEYQNLKDMSVDVIFENDTSKTYSFHGSDEILPAGSSRWYVNGTIESSNFKQLILISGTCPNTARHIVENSSISFVS